ncbi:MAG: alpha/beta hydrolase fold domain-containing protein [Chitinivibrionales bacterium]|nr:alpha/beta hydrolase fold domain-containing protein [Chitinivibrionales bacterium]
MIGDKKLHGIIILLLLGAPALFAQSWGCASRVFSRPDAFVFGNNGIDDLRMVMFTPDNWQQSDSRPAMLIVFAGGFNKKCVDGFTAFRRYYSRQGFVVFVHEYQLLSQGVTYIEEQVPDCKMAVRWVRKNAAELGVDPNRIISFGGSAGGFLSTSSAAIEGLEHSDQDLTISSKPDLCMEVSAVLKIAGTVYDEDTRMGEEIEALRNLSDNMPPTILMYGFDDGLKEQGKEFIDSAADYSFDTELHIFNGEGRKGHSFCFREDSTVAPAGEDSVISWTMAFFEKHGFLPEQDPVAARPFCRQLTDKPALNINAGFTPVFYTLSGKRILHRNINSGSLSGGPRSHSSCIYIMKSGPRNYKQDFYIAR